MNVLTVLCSGGWMPVHLSEGWRRLGWTVDEFFYGSHMGKSWTPEGIQTNHAINEKLFATAQALRAAGKLDLIFCVIYDDVLEEETARRLRALGAPMVNYHVDLVGQWHRVLRTGRYFDFVACAQRDHWAALRRAGIRPYYMPMAANPMTSVIEPLHFLSEEKEEVLYLGSPWPYRTQVLSVLAKERIPIKICGNGWTVKPEQTFNFQSWQKAVHDIRYYALPFFREKGLRLLVETISRRLAHHRANQTPSHAIPQSCIGGMYQEADFAAMVRQASINLGFSHFDGVPGTPQETRQVRLRDFEIPMAGGFYLAQDCDQIRECFEPGVHLDVWNDVPDLLSKIRFYLRRPKERRLMALAGQAHCKTNHTWEIRFKELWEELQIRGKEKRAA